MLRRLIRQVRPDIVHASLVEATLTARIAGLGLGTPQLDSLVNTTYDPVRTSAIGIPARRLQLLLALDRCTSKLVTHFHALTDAVKKEAVQVLGIPGDKVTVIPRGRAATALGTATSARRTEVRGRLGVSNNDFVILNVGRQDPQKAKVDLIEAFSSAQTRIPQLLLLIAGREGKATAEMEAAVQASASRERIVVLGHRDDVPDLLCAADLFVFPSLYEGLGGSLLEAMALSCTVIGSDAPAVSEVLGDGEYGQVVARGDVVSLAEAMVQLASDPIRREVLARRARGQFERRYELDVVVDEMARLYRSLLPVSRSVWRDVGRLIRLPIAVARRPRVLTNRVVLFAAAMPREPAGQSLAETRYQEPVDIADYVSLLQQVGMRPHPWAQQRYRHGSRFCCLVDENGLLSGGWIARGKRSFPVLEISRTLRFSQPSTVLFDFETPPEQRGHGFYGTLLREAAIRSGGGVAYVYAEHANRSSLRGVAKAGFKQVATLRMTSRSARIGAGPGIDPSALHPCGGTGLLMKVSTYSPAEFDKLRAWWLQLEVGRDMTAFQSYAWAASVNEAVRAERLSRAGSRFIYVVVQAADGMPLLIAPFRLHRVSWSPNARRGGYFMGRSTSSDYLDFVYAEFSKDAAALVLDYVSKCYGITAFRFERLLADSGVARWLATLPGADIVTENAVHVLLPPTMEQYRRQLTKSAKQNLRTARNRAEKDGVSLAVDVHRGVVTPRERQQLLDLRSARQRQRRLGARTGLFSLRERLSVAYARLLYGNYDAVAHAMVSNDDSWLLRVMRGDDVCAYAYGLTDERLGRATLRILHVSIDAALSRYSPGIQGLAAFLESQVQATRPDFSVIDFTRGNERYKYDLGGVDHPYVEVRLRPVRPPRSVKAAGPDVGGTSARRR